MAELSARGEFVVATREPERCRETFAKEPFLKLDDFGFGRGLEFAAIEGVEADEIDFCRNAVESLDEQIGVVRAVIEIVDDDVFEGDALTGVEREST